MDDGRMPPHVAALEAIDRTQIGLAGGKGANLGELLHVDGVRVPAGFCVTTEAFDRVVAGDAAVSELLNRLAAGEQTDAAAIRRTIESLVIPADLTEGITAEVTRIGRALPYAVRSSATAEDLPTASFAGQQDTYLDVAAPQILEHVSRCWASLFTDRAISYRARQGLDHRKVRMAVVIQQMVTAEVSGVLFTADPITGNRKVASVEAVFGLGEALVSGQVNADLFQTREGAVISRVEQHDRPTLTDAQLLELTGIGRRIEAHFGSPQDIEWCLARDEFSIVQARPITTLYPVPETEEPGNRVWLSVGHQQMMTDAMKPLGLSMWLLTTPAPAREAGGRLFVDATRLLTSPSRESFVKGWTQADPLVGDALRTVIDREGFLPVVADAGQAPPAAPEPAPLQTDRAVVLELMAGSEASLAQLKRDIAMTIGEARIAFVHNDIQELRRILFDRRSHQVFMSAMETSGKLNGLLESWLGEKNAVDTLTQSVSDNVTSEMGLALLDVADEIRPYPAVVNFLERIDDENFLEQLPALEGGPEARAAIERFLDKYGMRCAGEIDITRPRWSEHPSTLVPLILGNVKAFAPGAGKQRFEAGRQQAWEKEREVLARLRDLPDGETKAAEAKRMIERIRTFIGYREYPKYHMICRYFVYKQALLGEAERLVAAGVLPEREDVFFLSLQEFQGIARTNTVDGELIRERKVAFESYQTLTPPRVMTSEGEIVTGIYRRDDVPEGALAGLPVSAGTVEGRARVVLDMGEAEFEAGDILVTAYTDPSWTPVFLAIAGLVTEVGGLMTHGAVVAREYGLPAVVGVMGATRLISDGQRIRVHGSDGYVELLS
jgi:pyruvate,water dikinase